MLLLVFGILILIFMIATFSVSIFKTKRSVVNVTVKSSGVDETVADDGSDQNSNGNGGSGSTFPPKKKWNGVREAMETCYEGGGKFTVSFVPAGVWVGACLNPCGLGSCNVGGVDGSSPSACATCIEDVKIKSETFGNTSGVQHCSNDESKMCTTSADCDETANCTTSGSNLNGRWGSDDKGNSWPCNGSQAFRTPNCRDAVVLDNSGWVVDTANESNQCQANMDEQGWKSEIAEALKWWEECFYASTGQAVKFEILNVVDGVYGDEVFVDGYLPPAMQYNQITQAEMDAHGIGDIRISAYDFFKDGNAASGGCSSICTTLMYCYPHLPCGTIDFDENNIATFFGGCDYADKSRSGQEQDLYNSYRGNICINKSYCWRKDTDNDTTTLGSSSQQTGLFQEIGGNVCYHYHFSLRQVIAHELGHSIGLGHDCHPYAVDSGGAMTQDYSGALGDLPCVDPFGSCKCSDGQGAFRNDCNFFDEASGAIDNCACDPSSGSSNGCSIMQPYASPTQSITQDFASCNLWIKHYLKLFYCGGTEADSCTCANDAGTHARFANKFNPQTIMNKKLIKPREQIVLKPDKNVVVYAMQSDGKCLLIKKN